MSLPKDLKKRLNQAISNSVYDVKVNKYTRNLNIEFLPTMYSLALEHDATQRLLIGRIEEMMADLNLLLELDEIINEDIKEATTKFHHKIELLEKKVELDLEDITRGYLGFVEYEFAKGVIKDLVEDKYEKSMQELQSTVRIRRV